MCLYLSACGAETTARETQCSLRFQRFGGRRQLGDSFYLLRSHEGAARGSPSDSNGSKHSDSGLNACAHAHTHYTHNPSHLGICYIPRNLLKQNRFWFKRFDFMLNKFHQDFHMKCLFLPKCALLGCMLMWSNPISEFSAGPGTGFSGLGSWLLPETGGGSCCHT